MSESRQLYERRQVFITEAQESAVQADADRRYPELITPKGYKRNFSPALRDIIDFWVAHPTFFSSWITMRGQNTTEEQE